MSKTLAFILACAGLQACRPANLEFSDVSREPTQETIARNPVQIAAYQVLQKNCLSCHFQWQDYETDDRWQQAELVIAKDPDLSVLLSRVKHGVGTQDMPSPQAGADWLAFSQQDFDALKLWITDMAIYNDSGPSGGDLASGTMVKPSNNSPRIGDRKYVASILTEVFGPTASLVIRRFVQQKLSLFSGPCDSNTNPTRGIFVCDAGIPGLVSDVTDLNSSQIGLSSTGREGQRLRTCDELVYTDATVRYAISQATGIADLSYLNSGGNSVPSKLQLKAAYALFNPGRSLPASVVSNLETLATAAVQAGRPLDPWRYSLLAICYAPEWQIP